MDKRLLVIEKVLHQRKVLKRKLDAMLQSEIATVKQADISEICKNFKPDNMVIYLNQMDIEEYIYLKEILEEQGYLNEQLILFGTDEECREFKETTNLKRCIEIRRPLGINNFVLSVKAILGCQCRRKIQIDVYKRHILVVDDNPVSLKTIRLWLEDAFKVSVVKSGKDALKFLKKKNPDLILMDYLMPELDGRETLKQIREDPNTEKIPVVFLTELADNVKIAELMDLRPQGYYLKSAKKEEIVTALVGFLDML